MKPHSAFSSATQAIVRCLIPVIVCSVVVVALLRTNRNPQVDSPSDPNSDAATLIDARDLSADQKMVIHRVFNVAFSRVVDSVAAELEQAFSDQCQKDLFTKIDSFSRRGMADSPQASTMIVTVIFPVSDPREPMRRSFGDKDKLLFRRVKSAVNHPAAVISIIEESNGRLTAVDLFMEFLEGAWTIRND